MQNIFSVEFMLKIKYTWNKCTDHYFRMEYHYGFI